MQRCRARHAPNPAVGWAPVTAVAALVVIALVMTRGIWTQGVPVNFDAARHLLRAKVMAETFLPAGHIDGWSPWWYLGVQQFLFQSYGVFAAIAAAHLLTGGPLLTVFKVAWVLPIAALPPALWSVARRHGASAWAAVAGAAFGLAIGSRAGYGMTGLFGTGLLLQAWGLLLFVAAWPVLRRAAGGGASRIAPAALLVGVTLVVHYISGVFLLLLAGAQALGRTLVERDPRPLARTIVAGSAGVLLAVHSLGPALALRHLMGPPVGWGGWAFLSQLRHLELFGPAPLTLFVLTAVVWTAATGAGAMGRLAILALVTAAVAIAPPLDLTLPVVGNLPRTVLQPRALPYACAMAAVVAGHFLVTTLTQLWNAPQRAARPGAVALGAATLAMLVVAWTQGAGMVRTQGHLDPQVAGAYRATMEWLREHIAAPAVVAFEENVFRASESGAKRLSSLLNVETGLFSLAGDQAELTQVTHHAFLKRSALRELSATRITTRLERRGVAAVLLRNPEAIARLRDQGRWTEAARFDDVVIFTHQVRLPWMYAQERRVSVRRFRFAPEQLQWDLHIGSRQPVLLSFPVSTHPNWHASVGGGARPLQTFADGLLALSLEPGEHTLELRWTRPASDRACNAVSLLVLAVLLVWWWRDTASRRRA